MEIIPAIDLIDGKCVRLYKGRFSDKKEYPRNPLEIAENYKNDGAEWIHIIDLDGARLGTPANLYIAEQIKKSTNLKVEYGGGIRSRNTLLNILKSGIDRPILGTKAIEDAEFLKDAISLSEGKIIISLDFDAEGMIFKNGWQESTGMNIFDFAIMVNDLGLNSIIVTDISRDGTLEGVNIEAMKNILEKTNLKIFVAGGVTTVNDIIKLKEIEDLGVLGVIIGKALYENQINLKEAINAGRK